MKKIELKGTLRAVTRPRYGISNHYLLVVEAPIPTSQHDTSIFTLNVPDQCANGLVIGGEVTITVEQA
jgi:hypothetical protein